MSDSDGSDEDYRPAGLNAFTGSTDIDQAFISNISEYYNTSDTTQNEVKYDVKPEANTEKPVFEELGKKVEIMSLPRKEAENPAIRHSIHLDTKTLPESTLPFAPPPSTYAPAFKNLRYANNFVSSPQNINQAHCSKQGNVHYNQVPGYHPMFSMQDCHRTGYPHTLNNNCMNPNPYINLPMQCQLPPFVINRPSFIAVPPPMPQIPAVSVSVSHFPFIPTDKPWRPISRGRGINYESRLSELLRGERTELFERNRPNKRHQMQNRIEAAQKERVELEKMRLQRKAEREEATRRERAERMEQRRAEKVRLALLKKTKIRREKYQPKKDLYKKCDLHMKKDMFVIRLHDVDSISRSNEIWRVDNHVLMQKFTGVPSLRAPARQFESTSRMTGYESRATWRFFQLPAQNVEPDENGLEITVHDYPTIDVLRKAKAECEKRDEDFRIIEEQEYHEKIEELGRRRAQHMNEKMERRMERMRMKVQTKKRDISHDRMGACHCLPGKRGRKFEFDISDNSIPINESTMDSCKAVLDELIDEIVHDHEMCDNISSSEQATRASLEDMRDEHDDDTDSFTESDEDEEDEEEEDEEEEEEEEDLLDMDEESNTDDEYEDEEEWENRGNESFTVNSGIDDISIDYQVPDVACEVVIDADGTEQ